MYINTGGQTVEFLYFTLGVCGSIFCYFGYKFLQFKKKQDTCRTILENSLQQELDRARKEYQSLRLAERMETRHKTNIFREMAIEEIARQKLVYDEETGRYVRRRQIN